jgi:hypothetical protein
LDSRIIGIVVVSFLLKREIPSGIVVPSLLLAILRSNRRAMLATLLQRVHGEGGER